MKRYPSIIVQTERLEKSGGTLSISPQYWEIKPRDYEWVYPENVLSNYGREPNMRPLEKSLENVSFFTWRKLEFHALRDNVTDRDLHNDDYRGSTEDDPAPFVINGIQYGRITAQVLPGTGEVFFRAGGFRQPELTDSAKTKLKEMFEEQLAVHITDENLAEIKAQTRSVILEELTAGIFRYRAQVSAVIDALAKLQ